MPRKAVGSNQYRTRPQLDTAADASGPDLMAQACSTQIMRCGQVWGTRCRAKVQPPFYSHGAHGYRHKHVLLQDALADLDCPPAVMMWALEQDLPHLRKLVAQHMRCPPTILEELAGDEDENVVMLAAQNWACPEHILCQLSHHSNPRVLAVVAAHHRTPPNVLGQLPLDDTGVAHNVARNPNTPPQRLREMASHPDTCMFWYRALENPSCPPDLVVQMLGSDDKRVRESAKRSRALPEEYRQLLAIQS